MSSASSPFRKSAVCFAIFAFATAACSSSNNTNLPSSTGGGGSAGEGGGSGGGSSACWQVSTLLDVSKAPGAGGTYAKPTLSGVCTDTHFVVDTNGMPHYSFEPITPNPLQVVTQHYEIVLEPQVASTTTTLPLLGTTAFAVNGMPIFGPNEAGQPADEAWGDPIFNGIMDACLGHTADRYHYHSLLEKCLTSAGLVSEPWTGADPDATKPSPVIGWALDGFPIYGTRECTDSSCNEVVNMKSGYAQTGNPKTNAWQAYAWSEHAGDNTYLDECNGHTGPKGEYHYHVTEGFPYVLGCYRGTPNGGGTGMPTDDGGGMMTGPKACTSAADCAPTDCPQGSVGCTCGQTPMGMKCIPTCNTNADCPLGPNGMQLSCKMNVCAP